MSHIATATGSMDIRELRDTLGRFATGVAVVTGLDQRGEPVGLTINSFSSLSLDPPLILWSLARKSASHPAFAEGRSFAINILSTRQRDTCMRFAKPSEDKFAEIGIVEGMGGVPLIAGSIAHMECVTDRQIDAGDHVLYIGKVENYSIANDEDPLIFHRSQLSEFRAQEVADSRAG